MKGNKRSYKYYYFHLERTRKHCTTTKIKKNHFRNIFFSEKGREKTCWNVNWCKHPWQGHVDSPVTHAWCPVSRVTSLSRSEQPTNKGNASRARYMRSPTLALSPTRPPYLIARWPTVNACPNHANPIKCTTIQIGCASREDTAKRSNYWKFYVSIICIHNAYCKLIHLNDTIFIKTVNFQIFFTQSFPLSAMDVSTLKFSRTGLDLCH